jgi:hypothetical protein
MDTPYNRRIASLNDAIMNRAARHAPANFVGKGYGSDSGLNTQYNDVMRGAANQPRALSQAEKEYRMEGEAKAFGGSFMDDLGQAFRYTPLGMASDAVSGRDTVFSGRGGAGYGGGWMDDLGQAFRYTPIGMASDAISGRDTVFSGRGGAGYGGAGYGGNAATMVGTTMPYREVPDAGVIDHARSGSGIKYPANKVVQVGNSDGSGKPQVEAAWYENFDDFSNGRNRMRDSKKIGRMTKDPEMVASGGRDFSKEELDFVQNLFKTSGGAGFYGGEWYNDWDDFTEAVKGAYDTVKGVWEDYVKPVLDVVGTPVKDFLISSGNPYGEAGAGVLELLGYGQNGVSGGMYGAPSGMSGGMYGAPSGRSGGRAKLVKGSPEAKAYMASIRAKKGSAAGFSGGNMSMGMGMRGCGEGVFADAKPIRANSLGFSPKLEVEQLNAATGSTSYGDMPTSNPVGSGRKRKIVPKNSRGVSSAPTKMGEGYEDEDGNYILTPRDNERHEFERYASMEGNISADAYRDRLKQAGRDLLEQLRRSSPEIIEFGRDKLLKAVATSLPVYGIPLALAGYVFTQEFIDDYKKRIRDETKEKPPKLRVLREKGGGLKEDYEKIQENFKKQMEEYEKVYGDAMKGMMIPLGDKMLKGGKISRKKNMKEREGLAVSGDNSMGAIVAQRGYTKKAQKKSGAVVEDASKDLWSGEQFEELTGRSGTKNPSLVLEGGAMSGGAHGLIQQNNLQAVRGGAMSKMKSEYSGKGKSSGKKSAYNEFVSKVMREKGMKLAEATRYIKQNGLYKK